MCSSLPEFNFTGENTHDCCVVCLGAEDVQSALEGADCASCSRRERSAPAGHTSRSVSMFAVFAVPVPLLLRHGGNWDRGDRIQKPTLRSLPPLSESSML